MVYFRVNFYGDFNKKLNFTFHPAGANLSFYRAPLAGRDALRSAERTNKW